MPCQELFLVTTLHIPFRAGSILASEAGPENSLVTGAGKDSNWIDFSDIVMADVDYDSEEEEMLARSEELRALEKDDGHDHVDADGGGGDDDDREEFSQSQYSKGGSSHRSGDYSRSQGDYSRGHRGQGDDKSEEEEEDDDEEEYSRSQYSDDYSGHDERSYHTERSRRSQASAYSHHSQASDYSQRSRDSAASGSRDSASESQTSKSKSKKEKPTSKSKKFDPFAPVDPDRLSTDISKEEEEQLLAYQTPPVPLQLSGRYLRGPFGRGDIRNVLLGSSGQNGQGGRSDGGMVKMSRKKREGIIREAGRELNLGPLIVYDDDDDGTAKKPAGALIYGCCGPSPSSSAPPSAVSDPLGLHTDAAGATDKPVVTAADLLRWLTTLVHHHSVRRILCLLDEGELKSIAPPAGYRQMVESQLAGGIQQVTLCDLSQPGARDVALGAMEEAVRAGERIAVHCGDEHRTGTVLALWLCRYGEGGMVGEGEGDGGGDDADGAAVWRMRPEEAVARVVAEAARAGVSRQPVLEQVRALVEERCLPPSQT